MNNFKYWFLTLLFSIIPTYILHLLIEPMWTKKVEDFMLATEIESAITVIILPIYLAIFHFYLSKKYNTRPSIFIINVVIVFFCIWWSANLHFENWASSIGDKLNPDNATLEVIGLVRALGYIVSSIALLIAFFQLKKFNKKM